MAPKTTCQDEDPQEPQAPGIAEGNEGDLLSGQTGGSPLTHSVRPNIQASGEDTVLNPGPKPAAEALLKMFEKAERRNWETLVVKQCDFASASSLKSFILHMRFQIRARQGEFLFHWRIPVDEWLQETALLALQSSMPRSKRAQFERYNNFLDAWRCLCEIYSVRKCSDTVKNLTELLTISQKDGEPVLAYADRAETLWSELKDSDMSMPEYLAIDHFHRVCRLFVHHFLLSWLHLGSPLSKM
jgi:hypothetical protein